MQSRKNAYKIIADRYGLGYAEINNSNEIFLISSYLPNHPQLNEKKPRIPYGYRTSPLYQSQLKATGGYDIGSGPTHVSSSDSHDQLPVEEINLIISELDKQFQPLESKQDNQQTANENSIIFSNYRVGFQNPITDNMILWGSFGKPFGEHEFSEYGLVLDFENTTHLQGFLSGIPEETRVAANSKIYAVYECGYGPGCYQILIPHGQEHNAITLLFGANEFTAHLPITHYLTQSLKPTSFLSSPFRKSFTDEKFSAAMSIMMKAFSGKIDINDFEKPVRDIIQSTSNLKRAFLATVELCKNYVIAENAINGVMPPVLTKVVVDYYREIPKLK